MTARHPKEQPKAPAAPARQNRSGELESRELDQVVGGLKKSGPKAGLIGDPCEGGEIA